jgi:hypothetical protein
MLGNAGDGVDTIAAPTAIVDFASDAPAYGQERTEQQLVGTESSHPKPPGKGAVVRFPSATFRPEVRFADPLLITRFLT